MKISAFLGSAAVALSAMIAAAPAMAAPPAFMPHGAPAAAPPGFKALCQRDQASCIAPPQAVAALALDANSAAINTSSIGERRLTWGSAPLAVSAVEEDEDTSVQTIEVLRAVRPDVNIRLSSLDQTLAALLAATPAAPAQPAMTLASDVDGLARLTRDQMKLINEINRQVNREVRKADDFDLYGLAEYWSLPKVIDGKMYGDCEDYALEKRRRLIEAGVPASALSMAVAVTARGESHAVLLVAFEQGDWVLDNLTPWATPWSELNYRWIERQVAGSSAWVSVS